MRGFGAISLAILLAVPPAAALPAAGPPQSSGTTTEVDRILARIENDIITANDVRELARYQELVEGKARDDAAILHELIDQWVVTTAARQANFPEPEESEVTKQLDGLEKRFASPEAFQARLRQVGLTEAGLRRIVARQLYLTRYLDYRFRAGVQVRRQQIENYYNRELAPKLRAEGKAVPPLADVRREIRALLVERGIARQTDEWLKETEAHLEIQLPSAEKQP
jgi:hypothetical protein